MGIAGLVLAAFQAASAAGFDPVVKGAWPGFGPATAKAVAVERDRAYIAAGPAGLLILDVSDPSHPSHLGGLPLEGSAAGVAIAGDHAYVANAGVGSDEHGIFAGLHVIDIRNPANPRPVATLGTQVPAVGVAISGSRALVVDGGYYSNTSSRYLGAGVELIDIQDPRNPRRLGRVESQGRVMAFAIAGDLACMVEEGTWSQGIRSNNLSVIQISGAEGPRRVGLYPLHDVEVALALVGPHAYLALPHGLEVIDLTNPTNPRRLGWANLDDGSPFKGLAVSGSHAFAVSHAGAAVMDISRPSNPVHVGWIGAENAGGLSALPVVTGVTASGERLFRINEGFHWWVYSPGCLLEMTDISDPTVSRPTTTFTLQGNVRGIAFSGSLAFLANGFLGLQILDVSDPTRPGRVAEFRTGNDVEGIALAGNLACLRSSSGFDIVDASAPTRLQRRGRYELGAEERASAIAASGIRAFVYVDGNSRHLDVVDLADPDHPKRLIRYNIESWPGLLPIAPYFRYVPDAEEGWWIQDVTDPANPIRVGGYRTMASALGATLDGSRVHNALGETFDLTDPSRPWLVGGEASGIPGIKVARLGDLVCAVEMEEMRCYDVSDPARPQSVGRLAVGSVGHAVLRGTDLYLAAGSSGLLVVDLSPLSRSDFPRLDHVPLPPAALPTGGDARGVVVSGSLAYVADGGAGLRILDVSRPDAPTLVGAHPTDGPANDVAVAETYAYVAAGGAGLQVIEVSHPAQPRRVGTLQTGTAAMNVALVSSGYACVALDAEWGVGFVRTRLDVVNVRDPSNPRTVGNIHIPGVVSGMEASGHQVFVSSMGRYEPSGAWKEGSVVIVDLTDPAHPREAGRFDTPGAASGLSHSNGILCVVDRGVWTGTHFAGAHLAVLDVANPAAPRKVGEYLLAGGAGQAQALVMADPYAFLYLPSHGGLHVLDLSDPTRPTRINSTFSLGSALDLAVSGTRLFAAAGVAGLKTVDISTPSHPLWLGGYGSGGGIHHLEVAGSLAVATSAVGVLQILELSDSRGPRQIGVHVTQSRLSKVALAGPFAYVAEIGDQDSPKQVGGRLNIVDLADPAHPRQVGVFELAGAASGVAISGTVAFLALGELGLQTIDVSNPRAPHGLGRLHTDGIAFDVAIDRHHAWVANGSQGLQVIDVLDPSHPRRVGGHATGGAAERVAVVGHRVYVTDRMAGLLEFDMADPVNPRLLGRLAVASRDYSGNQFYAFSNGYACLMDASGLRVLDFHDPDRPKTIANVAGISPWVFPVLNSGKLYLPDGSNHLGIVELLPFFRSASHASGEIHLEWENWGKARLQRTRLGSIPAWQDVAGSETRQTLSLPASDLDGIFRLYRQ